MTRALNERDGVLVGRYADGEMQGEERALFERRLESEPTLSAAVRELRAMRPWFVDGPVPRPGADFRARVLTAALRPDTTPRDEARVADWSRRVLYAAAAVFVLGILVASGLLRPADSGRLEASPAEVERSMERLDARIEAEARRAEGK